MWRAWRLAMQFGLLRSVFFFKQKTAYEMRISDWSSDVCSSDLWTRPDIPAREISALRENPALSPPRLHRAGQPLRHRHGVVPADAAVGDALPVGQVPAGLQVLAAGHQVALDHHAEIGRASCRERVCQYV